MWVASSVALYSFNLCTLYLPNTSSGQRRILSISLRAVRKFYSRLKVIQSKHQKDQESQLVFICTHNSRRSHFGQVWAAVAAYYYGLTNLKNFSGGTDATAFNPRAVHALEEAGFVIKNSSGENPRYEVNFAEDAEPILCFSKKYDDPLNPQKNFIALMTCDEADQNCPTVFGAEYRFAIPYCDPIEADGSLEEASRYDERCQQIASEMFYLMSQVLP